MPATFPVVQRAILGAPLPLNLPRTPSADSGVVDPRRAAAEDVARLMRQRRVHRVFVTRQGRLCGVVSSTDLLRAVGVPVAPATRA